MKTDKLIRSETLDNLFIYKHRKEILKKLKPYLNNGFYNITNLLEVGAVYNLGYGEKSNGKSTAVQMVACVIFWLYGAETVLLRTYQENFKLGKAPAMFNGLPQGFMSYLTNGVYDKVVYRNSNWFFAKYDENKDKDILCEKPFCHRMSVMNSGASYQFPEVRLIFFDEFITKEGNYQGEFDEFVKVISTIVRVRKDIQIFMMGNTVNSNSIYFKEMGLKNIINKTQKQGTIDIYKYNDDCILAAEYCENAKAKVNNDIYFPFESTSAEMVKNGAWDTGVYKHLPYKYRPKDILFTYFIIFQDKQYRCDIITTDRLIKHNEIIRDNFDFTYIHESHEDLSMPSDDIIIFSDDRSPKPNIIERITQPVLSIHRRILKYWQSNKIFYQDNTVGDNISAYLRWCSHK